MRTDLYGVVEIVYDPDDPGGGRFGDVQPRSRRGQLVPVGRRLLSAHGRLSGPTGTRGRAGRRVPAAGLLAIVRVLNNERRSSALHKTRLEPADDVSKWQMPRSVFWHECTTSERKRAVRTARRRVARAFRVSRVRAFVR